MYDMRITNNGGIMGNNFKTTILLAVMTAFIVLIGQVLGGTGGMIIALFIAAGMNFFSYWFSDKIVLRMYNAQEASPNESPMVYEMVRKLALRAGLPCRKYT
jgi:heat shock protein HtpX